MIVDCTYFKPIKLCLLTKKQQEFIEGRERGTTPAITPLFKQRKNKNGDNILRDGYD